MTATILRVGTLIDGTGAEPVRDAEIRIDNGRVTAHGRRGEHAQPGDTVVERPEATAVPGFLDVHTHMCYPIHGEFQKNATTPSRVAMVVQGFRTAGSWLRQGVTTARDVGTAFDLDIELKELIQAGKVPGPRMVTAGRMMTMTGGKRTPWDHMKDEVSGPTQARIWARRHLKDGADVIKLYCTTLLEEDVATYLRRALEAPEGAPDPGRWASLSVDEIRAVTHEAHKAGRTVAAHAAPAFGVKLALQGGVDTVEHGSEIDDECIDLFLETGATLVPTLSVSHHQIVNADELALPDAFRAFSERRWDLVQSNVRKAHEAGVRIATGTDPVLAGMDYASEIELLVGCGLSEMDALLAATRNGAASMRIAGEMVGTVANGNQADLVLLGSDPLEDIRAVRDVREVWQGGRVVHEALGDAKEAAHA